MKNFKRIVKNKKRISKIGAAIVAAIMVVALIIGLAPNDTARVLAAEKVSDYGTETKFTESLGDNASTEYSGRIWTDKSVYSDSVTFDLYTEPGQAQKTATVSKDDDSDFLVAFSALGTTQSVSGQTQAPVDVVFVIDMSGSMRQNSMGDQTRMARTIAALNDAVETLLEGNENTRIGVVAFSGEAQVLLQLDHYTKLNNQNFFSTNSGQTSIYTRAVGDTTGRINKTTTTSSGTNIQRGIFDGMNMLATETETSVVVDGQTIPRTPSVVILSDGAPTIGSDYQSWWDLSGDTKDYDYDTERPLYGMQAIMTASYMKDAIDRNYAGAGASPVKVYSIGMGIDSITGTNGQIARITIDPLNYLNGNNDTARTIRNAWNTYIGQNNTGTPSLRGENGNYTFNHPNTGYDIDSIIYNDAYYSADNAQEVVETFEAIVSNISISAPQIPTEVKNPNAIDADGYITYTDPLGAYMEVKDVKAISYAGTVFTKDNSTKTVTTVSGTETTYKFAAEVHSPIYGDQNIDDILITVTEDADGMETITIKIPASVIPVRVNTVELNEDGTVKTHTNNGAYPVRVFYTVGLKSGIIENGVVKVGEGGVSEEYVLANSNTDGTVNFYSNLFTGENEVIVLDEGQEIPKKVGNTTVEFEPSHTNPFYYIIEDMPIYKDAAGETQLTAREGIQEGTTYYYKNTYYHGTSVEEEHTARTGAQLLKTDIIEKDGYLYRAKGSPRLNRIMEFEGEKIDNNTKTAEDFYAPTFEYASGSTDPYAGKFVIYLGNNGVLSTAAGGHLKITKNVVIPDGLNPATTEFEFTVNFNGNNTLDGVFAYDVLDASGAVLENRAGTIADGGKLKLAGGETAIIRNIPRDVTYEVIETEANENGFSTTVSGSTGTIEAGETKEAIFTNTYASIPVIVGASDGFQVSKTLAGRHWNGDAFTFILESVSQDAPMPSGSTNGVMEITIQEGANDDYQANTPIEKAFGDIEYSKPGTYVYTIAEKMPTSAAEYLPGMSYSGAIYRIEVVVTDNGTGQLEVVTTMIRTNDNAGRPEENGGSILAEGSEIAAFVNDYDAESTAWTPVGTKHYEDTTGQNPMTARMFQFRIRPIGANAANAPMPAGTEGTGANRYYEKVNNIGTEIAYPQIIFEHIHATTAGTVYTYEFSEVNTNKPGVTYDGSTYTVTVIAKIDSTTDAVQLEVSYEKDNASGTYSRVEFSNKYEPAPVTTDIVGSKTLTGITPANADDFQVKIEAADDVTKAVLANASTVDIPDSVINTTNTFTIADDLQFTKPGTYVFNVSEVNAGQTIKGITYDAHTEVVTVVIRDNNGALVVDSITYSNGRVENATFANTYASTFTGNPISLTGTKSLTGRDILAGEFWFAIVPQGNAPAGRASIVSATTDGKIQLLTDVNFAAAGTYEYWFYEYIPTSAVDNKLNGVKYDSTVYKFIVEVTDNWDGTFEVTSKNFYKTEATRDAQSNAVVANNAVWEEVIVSNDNDAVVFENKYATESVTRTVPTLEKVLSGYRHEGLKDNEFQFAMSVKATTLDENPKQIPETGLELADYITLNNQVENAANGILGTVSNKADGSIDFGNVTFHKPGLYTLTFEEVIPTDNAKVKGVTYTEEKIVAEFRVTDNGLGSLVANLQNLHGGQQFTNTYESEGELQLTIEKNFTGRENDEWLDSDTFQAEVVILDPTTQTAVDAGEVVFPSDSDGIQKITLTKNNRSVISPEIVIRKAGTYKFVVREVTGSIPGVNYDTTRYEVVVTATDNGDGTITVVTEIENNKDATVITNNTVTFNNEYDTSSTILSGHDNLIIEKEFTGREDNTWLDTDVFTFTLVPGNESTEKAVTDGVVELGSTTLEVSNANKAHAHFGAITFHEAGIYTFTITEAASTKPYIQHDADKDRTVIVEVKDDGEGRLVVALAANSEALKFTNKYLLEDVTLEGETNLKVEKVFTGRNWFDNDSFEFTLKAETGDLVRGDNSISTSKAVENGEVVLPNNADGITITKADLESGAYTKAFGDIVFKKTGTYQFRIEETRGNIDNVTYDSHDRIVTVVVTDDNVGHLVATPSFAGSNVFENVYTPDPVTATLTGEKVLNGRVLKAGEFRFHIEVAAGSEASTPLPATRTIANDENGIVTFATMTYAEPGTYKYTISEIKGHLAGVTYDEVAVEATVEVTYDASTGKLTQETSYKKGTSGTEFEFVNTYSTEPVGVTDISALKEVSTAPGVTWALNGNDFRFEIEPSASNPQDDPIGRKFVSNDQHGIVVLFENVEYKVAGTYVYTVHEVDGNRAGITYDDSVYTITVNVTDDESVAKLSAVVSITKTENGTTKEVENIEFDNAYDADEATAVIHGHKTLDSEHKELEADEFTFELKAVTAGAPMPVNAVDGVATVKNAQTGLFQFEVITYTAEGTYEYEVREVIPQGAVNTGNGTWTLNGKIYVDTVRKVTVTVVNDTTEGALKATVNGVVDSNNNPLVTFTNGYVPNKVVLEGRTALQGKKTLTGRDMKAKEFKFELSAITTGAPMPTSVANGVATAENAGEGAESAFAFEAITFTKTGEYLYNITEKAMGKGGVTYDTTNYVAKVVVTDEGYDGQLDAVVTYYKDNGEAALEFNNSYKADSVGLILGLTKRLNGRDLNKDEFTFAIKAVTANAPMPMDAEGKVADTSTNTDSGEVTFAEIIYDKAGTYEYEISEVKGSVPGVTYDEKVHKITVTVTDNLEGKLEAKAEGINNLVFTNVYKAAPTTAQINAIKKLTGRDMKAGEFKFVLEDKDGNKIYAVNTADGTVTFEKITYTEAGTYTYKLYEEKGNAEYVKYDEKVYTVTVVVEDDLEGSLKVTSEHKAESFTFNNAYEKPVVIETGDATSIFAAMTMLVLSAGYIVVSIAKARKK